MNLLANFGSKSASPPYRRPGRDIIHLVTVVSGHSHVDSGYSITEHYYPQTVRALVEAQQDVLVRGFFAQANVL